MNIMVDWLHYPDIVTIQWLRGDIYRERWVAMNYGLDGPEYYRCIPGNQQKRLIPRIYTKTRDEMMRDIDCCRDANRFREEWMCGALVVTVAYW